MTKKNLCYKKVKSKGPRPYVVFIGKKGKRKAESNFPNLKELREDNRFKKIRRC